MRPRHPNRARRRNRGRSERLRLHRLKLTDAVREIEEMADVRMPRQFIMAVIDGIGWKNRVNDLRRIYTLWERQQINGMYTLATLATFRRDLQQAGRLRGLLPPGP
jgi:hypothetical protein